MAYALFGLPVTISQILDVSFSRHLLGGGDSDRPGDRERGRFGFVPVLLLKLNDEDCWDVESLVADVLLILFRFEACSDDSRSGAIALGGADKLEVVEAGGIDLIEEGREMTLATFF